MGYLTQNYCNPKDNKARKTIRKHFNLWLWTDWWRDEGNFVPEQKWALQRPRQVHRASIQHFLPNLRM